MSALFGAAARATLTQPRPHISPQALADTIARYTHPHDAVSADLSDDTVALHDPATGTRLTPAWTLTALATDMSRARVLPDQIDTAFAAWAEHRHTTLDEATTAGRLVLAWADTSHTRLGWVTVVERLHGIVAPVGNLMLSRDQRTDLYAHALANSRALTPHLSRDGAITLISTHHPALATGLLTNPDQIAGFTRTAAPQLLVITPGAPIALGPAAAITRLSQDSSTDHTVTGWDTLPRT